MTTIDKHLIISGVDTTRYQAGACNIGPAEIRKRRIGAYVAFAAAAALAAGLIAFDAPAIIRLVVFAPLAAGFISWLQARRRFCAGFAFAGISNFGDDRSTVDHVGNRADRDRDRRAALRLVVDGAVLALAVTAVYALVPA